jgi:hypothetical protein
VRDDAILFNVEMPSREVELTRKMRTEVEGSGGEKRQGSAWFVMNLNGILLLTWLVVRVICSFWL